MSCASVYSCWCSYGDASPVVTTSVEVDGGATVQFEDGGVGHFVAFTAEAAGAKALVFDGATRVPVESDGMVSCERFAVRLPAETVTNAVRSGGDACTAIVADAGISQPPCNDVKGCSVGGEAPLLILVAVVLALRWRL